MINFNEMIHVALDKVDMMGKSNVIFKCFPNTFAIDFNF